MACSTIQVYKKYVNRVYDLYKTLKWTLEGCSTTEVLKESHATAVIALSCQDIVRKRYGKFGPGKERGQNSLHRVILVARKKTSLLGGDA